MVGSIDVEALEAELREGRDLVLLDVREPEEIAVARIPGSLDIPMAEIPRRLREIGSPARLAVVCHHGVRSMQVARYLTATLPVMEILNVEGGIDAWSQRVDPAVPRY